MSHRAGVLAFACVPAPGPRGPGGVGPGPWYYCFVRTTTEKYEHREIRLVVHAPWYYCFVRTISSREHTGGIDHQLPQEYWVQSKKTHALVAWLVIMVLCRKNNNNKRENPRLRFFLPVLPSYIVVARGVQKINMSKIINSHPKANTTYSTYGCTIHRPPKNITINIYITH